VLIVANVATYAVLVAMIIIYFVIPEQSVPQTCLDEALAARPLSAKEGIALAYFVMFVAVALAILVSFIVYSVRILMAWRKGQQFRSKSHMDYTIIARLIGCALVSGVGLVLRVISLLLPLAGVILTPIGVVVYLLFSDLIPTIFLIAIFKRQSGLQAGSSTGSSTASRSGKQTGGRTYFTSSTGNTNYSTMAAYDPASASTQRLDDM
jgi:hypothetical protein